jgi:acetolactate synthase-1/2/3 large subunit
MQLVDALVRSLLEWDARYVFGVSGANIEHLHDAIHRLGGARLTSVLAKSEVGAAFMADARARVHRTLGVCCATSGGGMMNLAVGLAESYAESVPVLAIVGQVPTTMEGRGGFQDSSGVGRSVDALGMFRAMTKHVARIDDPQRFWEQLRDAVRAALTGRPGPVVLLVPRDLYEREVSPMPSWFPRSLDAVGAVGARAPRSSVDGQQVDALFEALATARHPVIVAGSGVARSSDPAALVELARATGTPVVTTMSDPSAFPNDDPLWLGIVGASGHPSAHAYLESRADLLIAVGAGLNAMTRQPLGRALERCRVAAINVDPGELLRSVDDALVVEGDAGVAMRALLARHSKAPFLHAAPSDYALTRYRPTLVNPPVSTTREAAPSPPSPHAALRQSEALGVLEHFLPSDGHVLFDAGNCAAAALHYLTMPAGASSTIALGMGGMGYAIAGAIGAQLGSDRSRTVVFCGDGAFLMLGLEVHTAVALRLPILFVVFNNQAHGMCVTRQQRFFAGRVECAEYAGIDVATIARGLGPPDALWVGRASSRAELEDRVHEYAGHGHGRTGVLELQLDVEEIPPFGPLMGAEALETYVVRDEPHVLGRRVRTAA